jgi:FkbM family methyltransferase
MTPARTAAPPSRAPSEKRRYQAVDWALRHLLRVVPAGLRAEQAALAWGYRYRPPPRIVRLRSGARMRVEPSDYLQLLVYYLGTFEAHCLKWLRILLPRGGTFVDVGANVGVYTLEGAARVGVSGRVIAVEASPGHARTLAENVAVNDFRQVRILPFAVGEADGLARLVLPTGGNRGMFTIGSVDGEPVAEVPVRRLDDLLAAEGITAVDVLKMDIEGAELGALAGAPELLRRSRPAVIVELNEKALRPFRATPGALLELFAREGYRGWLIRRAGLVPLEDEPGRRFECDECLFVPRDRPDLLSRIGRGAGS